MIRARVIITHDGTGRPGKPDNVEADTVREFESVDAMRKFESNNNQHPWYTTDCTVMPDDTPLGDYKEPPKPAEKPIVVKLDRHNEEEIILSVDGDEIARVNHDSAGWSGMEAFESAVSGLVGKLGKLLPGKIELVEDETYGDEEEES